MYKKIMLSGISAMVLVFTLDGCGGRATVGNPTTLNIKDDQNIIVGKTTKAEIITRYGNPTSVASSGTDEVLSYSYTHAETKMNPVAFIPIVGLFAMASGNTANTQSASTSYTFIFDLNGVLKNKLSSATGVNSSSF